MPDAALSQQLPFTLQRTQFSALGERYEGKVRDTYALRDRLVLITTDRLSAFDHVLTTLPFKGDLLNQLAQFWFKKTAHVVKNHVLDVPDPCVTVARKAKPFAIEFVVRAYLTGSLWREYDKGIDAYGLKLPPGMKRDQKFDKPILTPSTKAPKGQHDEPISVADVVKRQVMSQRDVDRATEAAMGLFAVGQQQAALQGLIFVDTKYEFGVVGDELLVIDEMHTPDSSRFWLAASYAERFAKGEPQAMLDKENLRQWLINERGFSGHGALPQIPDEVRVGLTQKYLDAYQQLTGSAFSLKVGSVEERLSQNLKRAGLI
ncbi:MAG: phosphoribosylaminoimidazolesuccinocarboxamide synthase [Myxococcaceae bacterium]|nr:phosphoribosylaminoimidazolesuccinocarboxamide synthase [Myxococcaceae bacterium]